MSANLLEVVYEYQLLLHKRDSLDIPLDEVEGGRLVGLRRFLKGEYLDRSNERRAHRLTAPHPVQFTVPGGFGSGEVRSISSNGMAVVTTKAPDRGTRTILRVPDPRHGVEYVFPGRVVWASGPVIGVAFDGVPSRTPFVVPAIRGWRTDLPLAFGQKTPLVA